MNAPREKRGEITPAGPVVTPDAREVPDAREDGAQLGERRERFQRRILESLKKSAARIETLKSPDITDAVLRQVSDFFRETFNNEFPQFAACIPCKLQLPAWKVLGRAQYEPVSLAEMNALEEMPPCKKCGCKMELYHNPQATEKKLKEKFKRDADMVMIRANGKIQALTFGYKRPLPEIFANEWQYEYAYTADPAKSAQRNYGKFLRGVGEVSGAEHRRLYGRPFELIPEDNAYCWNCVVVAPGMRRRGNLKGLLTTFFASMPPEAGKDMPVLGEVMTGSQMHRILRGLGGADIPEVLGNELTLMCSFMRFSAAQFNT